MKAKDIPSANHCSGHRGRAATRMAIADNIVPMISKVRLYLKLIPKASRRKKSAISLTITAILPSSMLTFIPLRRR